ncbi:ANK_REP_REGION domain-containing protein [Candidatus Nitrotoga sp. BS]|uniref:ankyrin repeat domain-containing protein n=1 Tax=Candidatus Nitrotoga sp. BS TaxID=2890408 RepID=UPI001EF19F00|nr:ankyrin repeat domain-containing protein [Candidatus Nitrotoga sp. BS]CAH1204434.1 ANK_REP_REGION domain-containing protein [Candidatus Nitrotoga sp. BS]
MQNETDEIDESLITATMDDDLEGMKNAIQLGVDVNIQNFFGKTALHYIESIEAAQLLIDNGADPNIADYNNRPPIFDVNDPELAIFLINHGADAKFQDKDGLTALYIWVDFPEVAKCLLTAGTNPNVQLETGSMIIKKGNTALHKVENLESAQLLIEYGANITIQNIERATPDQTTKGETQRYLKSVREQNSLLPADAQNKFSASISDNTDNRLIGDTTVYHRKP